MDYTAKQLAEYIKKCAKQQDIRLRDLLESCSLNINTLSQMTDKKGISCFSLAKIADYLDCSVDYLLGRTDIPAVNRSASYVLSENESTYKKTCSHKAIEEPPVYDVSRRIAVLGKVAAGVPILSYENNYGTITPENSGSSYALIVQGDSMAPIILDKEYIEVVIQPALEQGEIGIIRVNDTTTCKKFYEFPDHYELKSINPEYNTMVIKKEPTTDLKIMGKVALSSVQKDRLKDFF